MKLYHGTRAALLPKILKKGLVPRSRRKGNWDKAPSRPDCLYLTDAYAGYFAIAAATKGQGCVVEIDTWRLSEFDLLPDEDFLAQAQHASPADRPAGKTLIETTLEYRDRLTDWIGTDVWELSLKHLGTCAHFGPIPAEAITRYALIDFKQNPGLGLVFDPTISLANYRLCGAKYRRYTAHLFGDPILPAQEGEFLFPGDEERCQFDRTGVTVVDLQKVIAA